MPHIREGSWAREAGVFLLWALLALTMTWPLPRHLGDAVLGPPGDNLEYVWKMWWFKHSLLERRASPFFNPDVFYPIGYPLALSETTLAHTLLGLPLTVLWGETVAYNFVILFSFVLSGYGLYRLLCALGARPLAALVGGAAFAFCPYRFAHLGAGHLPLMGTGWVPFLFLALERLAQAPSWRRGVAVGTFYALTALSSWYYALMFGLFGALFWLARARPWCTGRLAWQGALAAVLTAFLLIAPAALPMLKLYVGGQTRYDYSLSYVDRWSASPVDFVYPNAMHSWWGAALTRGYYQNIHENMVYLGIIAMALAIWGFMGYRAVPFVRVLALVGALALVLALGTTLHLAGEPVYVRVPERVEELFARGMYVLTGKLALNRVRFGALRRPGAIVLPLPGLLAYLFMPFMDAMRVWARFGLVTMFAVAVLAGLGAESLLARLDGRAGFGHLAGVGLLALVLLDFCVAPYPYGYTKTMGQPVDEWLAQQPRAPVIQFPLAKTWYGWALYPNCIHEQPLAYGYGTFVPAAYRQAVEALASWPSEEALECLRHWGVRYILVGARSYGARWPALQRELEANQGLIFQGVFRDRPRFYGDRLLYLVPPADTVPVTELINGPLTAYLRDEIYAYVLR
ncbi:MAG: hypothetical protein H5T69_07950 [Chloroflexi bacterium]|nr:hypothetical protein [Chloroflexota bacterium]